MDRVVGKVTQDLRERYGASTEEYRAFAFGFAAGQAEKVFLGVCPAAMFRPGKEHFDWYLPEVFAIASHYGLQVSLLESFCPDTPSEIWIHRDPNAVGAWLHCRPNSEAWHNLRARACGIPPSHFDPKYHLRKGYGERCDRPKLE